MKNYAKARIILAIQEIRRFKRVGHRAAAKFLNFPGPMLRSRMNGHQKLRESRQAAQKLCEIEEKVIIRYILHLDSEGLHPDLQVWKI